MRDHSVKVPGRIRQGLVKTSWIPPRGPTSVGGPPPRRRAPGQLEGLQGPKTTLRTPGGDPRVPQDGPREPQDGPREHPDGSRSFQDAQDSLLTSQDAPKTPQEASKMRPKRLPRRRNCQIPFVKRTFFANSPFGLSDAPGRPKKPPRPPQDGPRSLQEGPKTAQEGPKMAQEAPKRQNHRCSTRV